MSETEFIEMKEQYQSLIHKVSTYNQHLGRYLARCLIIDESARTIEYTGDADVLAEIMKKTQIMD